jgi:hypothetical protein
MKDINDETDQDFVVEIRWTDGLFESFDAKQIRASASFLWLRLQDGRNRFFPMCLIRWWAPDPEIHGLIPIKEQE